MSDLTWPTGGGHGSSAAGGSPDPDVPSHVPGGTVPRANGDPNQGITQCLRVAPSRTMRATIGDVEALLDGMEENSRRSCALLASELIAQVVARAPRFDIEPVALTVELREDVVRLEAEGPVSPSVRATADHDAGPVDPFADWGHYIIDRLADRWGVGDGAPPNIWAEIEIPVSMPHTSPLDLDPPT
jgi:hypothetical protein